jgi:hypothetical protein
MARTKILAHNECKPPKDNPKGYLKSIFFNGKTNVQVRLPGYMACDVCTKLVSLKQVELD